MKMTSQSISFDIQIISMKSMEINEMLNKSNKEKIYINEIDTHRIILYFRFTNDETEI